MCTLPVARLRIQQPHALHCPCIPYCVLITHPTLQSQLLLAMKHTELTQEAGREVQLKVVASTRKQVSDRAVTGVTTILTTSLTAAQISTLSLKPFYLFWQRVNQSKLGRFGTTS